MSVHLPLLWREFYFVVASKHPNFDKMKNNSLCLQFPWEEQTCKLEKFRQVNCRGYLSDAVILSAFHLLVVKTGICDKWIVSRCVEL